ncbi:MAG: stage 0 sporulation family protein [Firmicutes bacterium]|nr:stage 0 sporulation family protein [Candidatus Fermentithermobacillaceae bacterium]
MPLVVGVRFKEKGKAYYFGCDDLSPKVGDKVVVETVKGMEMGTVCTEPREVSEDKLVLPLKKVVRSATKEDFITQRHNQDKARQALEIADKKIREHGLDMRLVDAEYAFDGSRVTIYFTADARVDFRELVKDLASALKTRVELRQIGVRDEARLVGGFGPCGRELCCSSFLYEFQPVSIRMAKEQNLSLNPTKISGICGRLLCCLRFEAEVTEVAKRPEATVDLGSLVITPEGEGKVISYDRQKGIITVELDDGTVDEFPEEEVDEKK